VTSIHTFNTIQYYTVNMFFVLCIVFMLILNMLLQHIISYQVTYRAATTRSGTKCVANPGIPEILKIENPGNDILRTRQIEELDIFKILTL